MRTLDELKKYLHDNKLVSARVREDGYEANDLGYLFVKNGKKTKHKYDWDSHRTYNKITGDYNIGLSSAQSTFCCGVTEIGQFGGTDKSFDDWCAILEYHIVKEKTPYVRAETVTNIDMSTLEAALIATGYYMVCEIKSKHGKRLKQDYNIKVWEWLDPALEETKSVDKKAA